MCKFVIAGSLCGLLLVFADTSNAQVVRRGPDGRLRVRAPFVRVEVGPDGRTYVRAPFTSVYEPGDPRYDEYPGGPFDRYRVRVGEDVSVAQMDWWELRQYTRDAANHLEIELSRLDGAAGWRTALRPGTIRDLLAEDFDQPPDQATVEQLRGILESYDDVAESDDLRRIAQLGAFRAVRQGLRELILPPHQRLQRVLAWYWTDLSRDLARFPTGSSWQSFLELPPEVLSVQEGPQAPGLPTEVRQPDVQQLKKLLGRYDQVDRANEYRAIARLASFQATRELLAIYIDSLEPRTMDLDGPQPRPAEIPTPQPAP
jgi:hypothetical protein